MVRQSVFCIFLSLVIFLGIRSSLFAQSIPVNVKETNLIQEELKKVKPCRDVRWNRGTILLKSGEQLESYLCYAPSKEVLLSYKDGKVRAFSVYQIENFSFFDQDLNLTRRYMTFSGHPAARIKRSHVYEIVYEGDFSLLRRETSNMAAYYRPIDDISTRLSFDYFVLNGTTVWSYRQFQKEFLTSLASEYPVFEKWSFKERPELAIGERRRMVLALNRLRLNKPDQEKVLAKN